MKQLMRELILADMLAKFMAKLSCLYILNSAEINKLYTNSTLKEKNHRSQPERTLNGKIQNNLRKKINNNIDF